MDSCSLAGRTRLDDLLGWRSSSWRIAMDANERELLPSDLVRGRARFQAWRERRALGKRIPQPLWALAVRLAKTHGVSRTATALGLDYYSLKKRADASATAPPPSGGPTFVELTTPAVVAKQCQFE